MSGLTASKSMRALIVEDEPWMAEAIRDGLRLEVIAVRTTVSAQGRDRI